MLIVNKETQKELWKKQLKELQDKANKIDNRKEIMTGMAKEMQEWEQELGKEFHLFCSQVTGKEKATYFEVMEILNG